MNILPMSSAVLAQATPAPTRASASQPTTSNSLVSTSLGPPIDTNEVMLGQLAPAAHSAPTFMMEGPAAGEAMRIKGGTVTHDGRQYRIAGGDVHVKQYTPTRLHMAAKLRIDSGIMGIKVTKHVDADFKMLPDGKVRFTRHETDERGTPKPNAQGNLPPAQILEVLEADAQRTVLRPRWTEEVRDGKTVRVPLAQAQPNLTIERRGDQLVVNIVERHEGRTLPFRFEMELPR